MQLRDYQQHDKSAIYDAFGAGARCVMYRCPTGGGKSVLSGSFIKDHNGASCVIAHRKELVGQLSLALAREAVYHRVIGPTKLLRYCAQEQFQKIGRSYVSPHALCAVAGINTLVNRGAELASWLPQVTRVVGDEGHHYLKDNIWGEGLAMLPNAEVLLVSATPGRADGKGLGRHAHGVADVLVEGPEMRWLIEQGYLTDYRLCCPETHIDLSGVAISDATGDYVQPKLVKAVRASPIIGDAVKSYLKFTPGAMGIVFCTDVDTATKMAQRYRDHNVRAEVVSSLTEDSVRSELVRRLEVGKLDLLLNVDLFGEGFDLPAVEVVILTRPTASRTIRDQQVGRGLRPMFSPGFDLQTRLGRLASIAASKKPKAVLIDHVGITYSQRLGGLPDRPYAWTLDPRDRGGRSGSANDAPPMRVCVGCTQPYERFVKTCPYCGYEWTPAGRSSPEQVEGAILELAPEVLAAMRGQVSAADADPMLTAAGMPSYGRAQFVRQHGERREAQEALRASITWLAGWHRARGATDREIHMRFYDAFGVDVLSAQALGRPEAYALAERVNRHIGEACR